jgi:dUTP pyrophosphatase
MAGGVRVIIKFELLRRFFDPNVHVPTAPKPGDLGIDLYADSYASIAWGRSAVVSTGVKFELPEGYGGIIKNRGSEHFLIGSGVIDSGYRGEILVRVFNVGEGEGETLYIYPGDSLGQLILIPTYEIKLVEAKVNVSTERSGRGGIHGNPRTQKGEV